MPPLCFFLASAPEAVQLPLSMLIVFGSAKLLAEVFERLGQPGIVGEILAGILIGPSVFGWIQPSAFLTALAELGVMFLLFQVGLEVKSSELIRVGGTALLVAVLGVMLPFGVGWGILRLFGEPQMESIFVGAAMVATSVGITAQVLAGKGLLSATASKVILAAAVIDDVLGLLVLAVVSSLAKGPINVIGLLTTAVVAVAFTVIVATFGTRTMTRFVPRVGENLRVGEAQFAFSMCLLFALALFAVVAGVAAIVGAFLAGMALSDSVTERVHDLSQGVTELLVPFFLAGIGLHFDVSAFGTRHALLIAAAVFVAAIVTKLVGCGAGALSLGGRNALRVGIGMVPRGEVGMVVAQIGLGLGVIAQHIYGVVVFMSVATTIVAPPLIAWAFRGVRPTEKEEVFRLG